MTKNIDSRKLKMIALITSLSSEKEIEKLEIFFKLFFGKKEASSLFKEPRKSISLDELKEEQNYKDIDRSAFDKLVEKLNIEESIDDLLAMNK